MEIEVDGVSVICLPDNAMCQADEQGRSPEALIRCPLAIGEWDNICKPAECEFYTEVTNDGN